MTSGRLMIWLVPTRSHGHTANKINSVSLPTDTLEE